MYSSSRIVYGDDHICNAQRSSNDLRLLAAATGIPGGVRSELYAVTMHVHTDEAVLDLAISRGGILGFVTEEKTITRVRTHAYHTLESSLIA